jgi:hypothetical protein
MVTGYEAVDIETKIPASSLNENKGAKAV